MFPKVHEELYVLSSNSKYELYLRITCKRESEREIEDAHPQERITFIEKVFQWNLQDQRKRSRPRNTWRQDLGKDMTTICTAPKIIPDRPSFNFSGIKISFATCVLSSLRLFKLKIEGQTTLRENLTAKFCETQIKILGNPRLA